MEQTLAGAGHMLVHEPRLSELKRFMARATARSSRHLLDAFERVYRWEERIGELKPRLAALDGTDVVPPPLITGDDLVKLGLKPGPLFKELLEEVYDMQLEGTIRTQEDAISIAKITMDLWKKIKRPGIE
jgi:poly(A) polymerase